MGENYGRPQSNDYCGCWQRRRRKNVVVGNYCKNTCTNLSRQKILAIDADPAVGLSTALGIEVKHTIDDIRKDVIENVEQGNNKQAIDILNEARFRIYDALVETDGFTFIAVGRPESAGCYCKINSYLKDIISILSEEFDYVVIDGEAGIEQINRRVMEKVTHLILITDTSKKDATCARRSKTLRTILSCTKKSASSSIV